MTAAAEDAGAAAGGVGALVADVQRQVSELEAAQDAAASADGRGSDPESDGDPDMPDDAEGVERIANYFAEQARRKQVRQQRKTRTP